MLKNNFLVVALVLSILLTVSNISVYATSNDAIQPYMPVQDYDDDFLEAYQETVAFMEVY